MNNADYWKKRTEQKLNSQYKKADALEQDLKEQYEKALIEINKQISNFYLRFANDNEMNYAEATQQLNGKEFNRWRKSIDAYIKEIEATGNEQLLLELNTLAMKSRINRLDSLMTDIHVELSKLYSKENEQKTSLLKTVIDDTYYQTIYEVQVGRGIGHTFVKLDDKTVEDILNHPWSGDNYSNRIWKQKDKLVDTIKKELTQKFIQGKDVKTTAKAVAQDMNVSYRNAATLVQTESSYIIGEATARGYEATGVEKYEILATLDIHTSDICRKEDGKVYDLKDKTIGVNYPPFHIRCRTTTVPYFADDVGERAARDPVTDKIYYVDGNMTYEDWYKEHVANNPEALAEESKIKNKSSDKKQHKEYKNILGKEVPKSFDKFQDLKYNNVNEWENLKSVYSDKLVISSLSKMNIEVTDKIGDKQFVVNNYNPKISEMTQHANDNLENKSDRVNMTADRAQSFIDNAKLVMFDSQRKTIKFMAESGYAVLNLNNKLVTAVPQKWRNKYNKYLKEK